VQTPDSTLISWTALIAAVGSVLTAIVAAVALMAAGRRNRLSIGINNLWKLIDGWESSEMKWRRALLARELGGNLAPEGRISDHAVDVLNTFELLGYLVRSKVLALDDAWVNFSSWAISWYYIYEAPIHRIQREDPTVFEDYSTLVAKFIKYEAKRKKVEPTAIIPDATALKDFLIAEEALSRRDSLTQQEPARAFLAAVIRWLESWFSGARDSTPSDVGGGGSGDSGDPH